MAVLPEYLRCAAKGLCLLMPNWLPWAIKISTPELYLAHGYSITYISF